MSTQVQSVDPLELGSQVAKESHSMDVGDQTDPKEQQYMLFRAETSAQDA